MSGLWRSCMFTELLLSDRPRWCDSWCCYTACQHMWCWYWHLSKVLATFGFCTNPHVLVNNNNNNNTKIYNTHSHTLSLNRRRWAWSLTVAFGPLPSWPWAIEDVIVRCQWLRLIAWYTGFISQMTLRSLFRLLESLTIGLVAWRHEPVWVQTNTSLVNTKQTSQMV